MSLAQFAQYFLRAGNYRVQLFQMLAFLLRYGPKSIDEIMRRSTSWNMELCREIGEIMREEKAGWEQGLMTGDS